MYMLIFLKFKSVSLLVSLSNYMDGFVRHQKTDLVKKAHLEINKAITKKWKTNHDKQRANLFDKCVKAEVYILLSI